MIELGQLERHYAAFAKQNARIVVASLEGRDDARQTQSDFPHLLVLADQDRKLATAAGVIHERSNPTGGDTSAPTTIIMDEGGVVRWIYRSPTALVRLSSDEVLQAVIETQGRSRK